MYESEATLPLELLHQGKVRDVYRAGQDRLLLVASDRISAFDVVMSEAVPGKGEILTLLTAWWLSRLEGQIHHHLLSVDPEEIAREVPALSGREEQWARRASLVRQTRPLPVECVIRGYISGSAWQEYRNHGTLAGEPLPTGLRESDPLEPPIFSPATKATSGHDENIPPREVAKQLGEEMAAELEARSRLLYEHGARTVAEAGLILADTKFEFGLDPQGRLTLIDEVLTPDSSRYWPVEAYAPGRGQPSMDKQPIRDFLAALPDWDRNPPPPSLPTQVIEATRHRYRELFQRLSGYPPEDYPLPRFQMGGAP
ncbi:MAG: phosphoribosylaminoimidazolesuccinocarboxamide synthase [Gemmatimonadota bacterium]